MTRTPALVEIHYALWCVLAVPLAFAGLFFVLPGLIFVEGFLLMGIAGFLLFYISRLTRLERFAWFLGLLFHAALLAGAAYYIPRWEAWLAWPLAAANAYSLLVLVFYRLLWAKPKAQAALAGGSQ